MNIATALQKLKAKNKEYCDSHERILKALNIEHTKTLKHYVELIHNDTLDWINIFPKEYCSRGALAKPKSALFHLLEKDVDVRKELGETYCDEVVKHVASVWKANWEAVLKERESNKEVEVDEQTKVISKQGQKTKQVKSVQLTKVATKAIEEDDHDDVLADDDVNPRDMLDKAVGQIELITKKLDVSERNLEYAKKETALLIDRIEKLKVVLISILKNKGATDSDIEVYNALFTMLH